jgi:hypothetical protein
MVSARSPQFHEAYATHVQVAYPSRPPAPWLQHPMQRKVWKDAWQLVIQLDQLTNGGIKTTTAADLQGNVPGELTDIQLLSRTS